MADDPENTGANAIRDDNLRMILSARVEEQLDIRVRERFIANACIAGVWLGGPIIFMVGRLFVPEHLAGLGEDTLVSRILVTAVVLWMLFAPFAAAVVIRNMYMARRYIGYFQDHATFLDRYKRDSSNAHSQVDRYTGYFYMFSVLLLILGIFLWCAIAIEMAKHFVEERQPGSLLSDTDACRLASFGNPDGMAAVARRSLSLEECEQLLAITRRQ